MPQQELKSNCVGDFKNLILGVTYWREAVKENVSLAILGMQSYIRENSLRLFDF